MVTQAGRSLSGGNNPANKYECTQDLRHQVPTKDLIAGPVAKIPRRLRALHQSASCRPRTRQQHLGKPPRIPPQYRSQCFPELLEHPLAKSLPAAAKARGNRRVKMHPKARKDNTAQNRKTPSESNDSHPASFAYDWGVRDTGDHASQKNQNERSQRSPEAKKPKMGSATRHYLHQQAYRLYRNGCSQETYFSFRRQIRYPPWVTLPGSPVVPLRMRHDGAFVEVELTEYNIS